MSGGPFLCPACGWEGHPSFDLNVKGKLVACCGGRGCGYQDPTKGPADFTVGLAVPKDNPKGAMVEVTVVPPVGSKREAEAPAPRGSQRAGQIDRILPPVQFLNAEPPDVIGGIVARCNWLEAEIAKRDGYAVELRKLKKMIAAARRVDAQIEARTAPVPPRPEDAN